MSTDKIQMDLLQNILNRRSFCVFFLVRFMCVFSEFSLQEDTLQKIDEKTEKSKVVSEKNHENILKLIDLQQKSAENVEVL